jgi:TfoX/Sxy family transcriptional regulator of competence genes
MVQKEEKTATAPTNAMGMFGDMSLLREIIMGPKVIEDNQRFVETEALMQKNEDATRQRFEAFEKEMNTRFDRLEQLLTQNVEKLNTQMQNMSKSDKANIADLLVELSKKLKD